MDNTPSSSRLGIGEGSIHTLFNLLNAPLTRSPKARNTRIASSTTARAARKFTSTCKKDEMMIGVVYYPNLLDRSLHLASLLTNDITLDEANCCDVVFMTYISSKLTSSFCSPELFSEHDSREYINAGLIRPALAAMHIVTEGVPQAFKCTDSNTDVYVASGFKIKGKPGPITDCLLIEGPYEEDICIAGGDDDDSELTEVAVCGEELTEDVPTEESSRETIREEDIPKSLMAIECKTSNALKKFTFDEVLRLKKTYGYRGELLIRFVWPRRGTSTIRKSTKMLAQVYEEMIYNDDEYAWLSSFDVNIFFYMKRGSRILYMSEQYNLDEMTPLHVFAWFCRAKGVFDEDLKVPTPDETYFDMDDPENPDETGLITKPIYNALKRKSAQSKVKRHYRGEIEVPGDVDKTPRAKVPANQRMRKRQKRD